MCIGCGACIDACDDVMDKMNYPRGLIRYTSEYGMLNGLNNQQVRKRLFRPRVFVYIALLCIFIIGLVTSLSLRSTLDIDVVRDRGLLGREIPGGLIENVYRVQVINMTENAETFEISATGDNMQNAQVYTNDGVSNTIHVEPFANQWVPMVIRVPMDDVKPGESYKIDVWAKGQSKDHGALEASESNSFYAPK